VPTRPSTGNAKTPCAGAHAIAIRPIDPASNQTVLSSRYGNRERRDPPGFQLGDGLGREIAHDEQELLRPERITDGDVRLAGGDDLQQGELWGWPLARAMPFAISSSCCCSDLSTKSDRERTSRDEASHAPAGGFRCSSSRRAQRDTDRVELLARRRRKQRRRHQSARDRKRHLIGVRDVEPQIEGDRHRGGSRRRPERLLADERTGSDGRQDELRAVVRREQRVDGARASVVPAKVTDGGVMETAWLSPGRPNCAEAVAVASASAARTGRGEETVFIAGMVRAGFITECASGGAGVRSVSTGPVRRHHDLGHIGLEPPRGAGGATARQHQRGDHE
jgi:hypothetical protein